MSADLLRRAATALRHHVAELPVRVQSEWMQDSSEIYTAPNGPLHSMHHVGSMSHDEGAEIAYYVILMHPPVALALAELLERYAGIADDPDFFDLFVTADVIALALALALAILREPS